MSFVFLEPETHRTPPPELEDALHPMHGRRPGLLVVLMQSTVIAGGHDSVQSV